MKIENYERVREIVEEIESLEEFLIRLGDKDEGNYVVFFQGPSKDYTKIPGMTLVRELTALAEKRLRERVEILNYELITL